ncbi:MAG: glycosyltransferase family 4 protein [Polyangiaceae bacterium]|nr:glycosyltransferase family 4 protein [Polyangiaceae bacterium]
MNIKKIAIGLGGTDLGRSGIGRYVRSVLPGLLDELRGRGIELVAIGTQAELDAYRNDLRGVTQFRLADVFESPVASAFYYLAFVGRTAKRLGANVLLLPAANRRGPLWSGIPTVGVVHDFAQGHIAYKYDPARMFYARHVLTSILRSQTRLIAVSRATKADVEHGIGVAADVRVVPAGVDIARFAPVSGGVAEQLRTDYGLEREYILYLSRLELPAKNHLRLLKAFQRSRLGETHDLVIAGEDCGGAAAIRREIGALGLENVKLLGYIPDERVPALVGAADVVTMMGLREGFGLPVLEALASGRPVVASRTGAIPEVAGSLGVLCDPLNVGAISDALTRAVEDDEYRGHVERNARLYASRWQWRSTSRALADQCVAVGAVA